MDLLSDENGRLRFAVIAGPKLGGGDERLEALGDFYRELARDGVAHALVFGPLFDPHANVRNGAHLRYLVEHYPRVAGVTTHFLQHGSPRPSFGSAMRAAGRSDWQDFTDPIVRLHWLGTPIYAPLLFTYDEVHPLFDLSRDRRRRNAIAHGYHSAVATAAQLVAALPNLVAVFGGQRQHDCEWRDGWLFVNVGVFSGAKDLGEPVGATVFNLGVQTPSGLLDQSGHPTEFWDFNEISVVD